MRDIVTAPLAWVAEGLGVLAEIEHEVRTTRAARDRDLLRERARRYERASEWPWMRAR
jgi:hypothetical protein